MVSYQTIGDGLAVQFFQINVVVSTVSVVKTVGEVVGGDANDGVIGDSCQFQLFHQMGQSVFQFQVSGVVAFYDIGTFQMGHAIPIFLGHGVTATSIGTVTADGHVVNVKGLFIDVSGQSS